MVSCMSSNGGAVLRKCIRFWPGVAFSAAVIVTVSTIARVLLSAIVERLHETGHDATRLMLIDTKNYSLIPLPRNGVCCLYDPCSLLLLFSLLHDCSRLDKCAI